MAKEWRKAKRQIKAFRDLINAQPGNDNSRRQPYCFVLGANEIKNLLEQDEKNLDGIRIYLAAEVIQGKGVTPQIYLVGCEKTTVDGQDQMYDYNLTGDDMEDELTEALTASKTPSISGGLPCPTWCPKSNFLNAE